MARDIRPWHLRWRQRLRSVLWTMALVAMLAALWWTNRPPLQNGHMLFASDGDSFSLGGNDGPVRIRLTGIDAPELAQTCRDARGAGWPCGIRARDALSRIVARKAALSCSSVGKDRYDRALSRCQLADGRDLAAQLVRDGWAMATDEEYLLEQGVAQSAKAGIWQGTFEAPADWRTANPRSNAAMLPPS
jgi:endonuclease YncB( thermonuclease family)